MIGASGKVILTGSVNIGFAVFALTFGGKMNLSYINGLFDVNNYLAELNVSTNLFVLFVFYTERQLGSI